ncbi:MAG: hypothetical protein AB1Z98_11950 [Nannocystaceae bacterium]
MPKLRPIALVLLLSSACSKDTSSEPKPSPAPKAAAATPPPVTPPHDPHAIAKAMDEQPPPPQLDNSAGSFDLTIDGKLTHMLRIPRGQNRAVSLPDSGVARVSIAAAEGHQGWPHLRIVLEGLKLDAVTLPLTLPSDAKGLRDIEVSAQYKVNDNRIYTEEGAALSVTLESFVGSTLEGRFEGTLAPTNAGLGDPVAVSGRFDIELGLRGITPGPQPDGTPTKVEPSGHDVPAGSGDAEGTQPPL